MASFLSKPFELAPEAAVLDVLPLLLLLCELEVVVLLLLEVAGADSAFVMLEVDDEDDEGVDEEDEADVGVWVSVDEDSWLLVVLLPWLCVVLLDLWERRAEGRP